MTDVWDSFLLLFIVSLLTIGQYLSVLAISERIGANEQLVNILLYYKYCCVFNLIIISK